MIRCFVIVLILMCDMLCLSSPLHRLLKSSSKPAVAEGRDRSGGPAQKRPVRPILPAYCSTGGNAPRYAMVRQLTQFSCCGFTHWLVFQGRTLVHIFAVPSEKAANNNRSLTGNYHLIRFSYLSL